MKAREEEPEQKYVVNIGLKNKDNLIADVCQEGVNRIFADVLDKKEFIVFYCCKGDKTLVRTDEIHSLISKKAIKESKNEEDLLG
tara:strand:- start:884 stop:1138 length:255 start_codon:yes stop_codon:yes gene_type:complete